MGQEQKRYHIKWASVIALLLLFFLLCVVSAVPDLTVIQTDRTSYNPRDTVRIYINDSSNFTVRVIDPVGSQTTLALMPASEGYTAEYSAQQGVVLGTYTILVEGEQINDAAQFQIRTLAVNPDFKAAYPRGNIVLQGGVMDAGSLKAVNASLNINIDNETFEVYAADGFFAFNYSAGTAGKKTVIISAADEEKITGEAVTALEVYALQSDRLNISTSQAVYEAGRKVIINVYSPQGKPEVWVTDPLGNPVAINVSGKKDTYSGTYRSDKQIILGEYWAEAAVQINGSLTYVKTAFTVTAPSGPPSGALGEGISFFRELSGPKTGQHKAPPETNINMTITVYPDVSVNATLVDYFPNDWIVTDASGGTVSTYDAKYDMISWPVSGGGSVMRWYIIESPQRTSPPTRYYFYTTLGENRSDDWQVTVSDPTNTYYFHPETVNAGADGVQKIANTSDNTGDPTDNETVKIPNYTSGSPVNFTNITGFQFYTDPAFSSDIVFTSDTSVIMWFGNNLNDNNFGPIHYRAVIYDYDPSTGGSISLGSNDQDFTQGTTQLTFTIPTDNMTVSGGHRLKLVIQAKGNDRTQDYQPVIIYDSTTRNSRMSFSYSEPDTQAPLITNISENPNPQVINNQVNITASVADNVNVGTVYINITLPNSTSTGNLSMVKDGVSLWYYNYDPPLPGIYNFTVYSNDTSDNWNSAAGNFSAQTPPDLTFTLTPEYISSNIQTKFSLNVTNQGQAMADAINLNLTLPAEFASPWTVSDGGSYDSVSGNITWTLVNLSGGMSKYLTFWSSCTPVDSFNLSAYSSYQDINAKNYNSTANFSVTVIARIAVYNGTGADLTSFNNIISKLEIWGFSYSVVDENDINGNNITGFDLLIIGSGVSTDMKSAMSGAGKNGLTNIQDFVINGGGYIGLGSWGGGAYLAGDEGGADKLVLTDSRVRDRGKSGQVVVRITDATYPVNEGYSGEITVLFDMGTYFENLAPTTIELSAYYSNINLPNPDWNAINTKTASLADQKGDGLAALFGWDLLADSSPETELMFENAINWAIRKGVKVNVTPLSFPIHRNETKQINVSLYNNLTYNVSGTLKVAVPSGWTAENGTQNPVLFNLTAGQTGSYIFNVTAYEGAFYANYTLWAYAAYQGRMSQNSTVAQIIGPGVSISRTNPELFVNPGTNSTVTLTINNSFDAEETARWLNVTEMVPSAWNVNTGSISPAATTWQDAGIFYIQWSLPDLAAGSQTSVSYEVESPDTLLRYTFKSSASYFDDYNTLIESREYHEVTVVSAFNFSAGTLIVPMDDKQSGISSLNGQPRQLVAYGFLYNITTFLPAMWAVQDVGAGFTASTVNVWNGTPYLNETFSGGPFILSNLESSERDLVIQTAAYYNITLHNSSSPFQIQKGIILGRPKIAYYVPDGNPDQNNGGREDLILNRSLVEYTYLDKFEVTDGALDDYDSLIVPCESLRGSGPVEEEVIDRIYDWLIAGGSLWVQDEAAYEMVKYRGLLDLTPENFRRGGLGNLSTGNNLTVAQTHIVTQSYGQVTGYPDWYDIIFTREYARSTLLTLEDGTRALIVGKEGSGEVYVTTLELLHDQVETASNIQGRRLIDNFVFAANFRSAAALSIQGAPPAVVVYPGSSAQFNITAANTGAILLNNVTLQFNSALDPAWITISPFNYSYLDIEESGQFTVNISAPSNATAGYVLGTLEAGSREGAADIVNLPVFISNLMVSTDVGYYHSANQTVLITVNVTDLALVPVSGASVDLILTEPDGTGYLLSATETAAGTYTANFSDTVQLGEYVVEAEVTRGANLGYNYTYFMVDSLLVDLSFYADAGYTIQSRNFDINDTMYIQANVTYSNYTNASGVLSSINVTLPNGTVAVIPATEVGPGLYRGSYGGTQTGGSYVFYALAEDSRSITGSDTDSLDLPVYTTFPPGTLVIPMGPQQNTGAAGGLYPSQVSAYGLVHWLLANNTTVDWVVRHDRTFDGVDFNATTDDNPSNVTGTVQARNYYSGPFLIRDPDPGTAWNEAWDTIQQIIADTGRYGDVVVHELNQSLLIETRDDYVLDRPARIAVQSTDEAWIRYLWDNVNPSAAMNITILTPAQIRSGILLTNSSVNCSRRKAYDWIFFDDDNFWDTGAFPAGDNLFTQLDLFVNKTGHVHLQGLGATMNTRTAWLTAGTTTYEEIEYNANQPYEIFNQTADHPLAQTWGTTSLKKPNINMFDALEYDNNWLDNIIALAGFSENAIDSSTGYAWDLNAKNGAYTDSVSGVLEYDYTFVAANNYGGVTSALTDREQDITPEMRLALNSVLFSVVTPEFDHYTDYQTIKNGGTSNLTVTGTVDSGMLLYNILIYDELPPYVTLDNSSISLYVGGSYSYDASSNMIIFNLGSPGQAEILNGTLFSYGITVTPPPAGAGDLVILNSSQVYDDNWNSGINPAHCLTVKTIDYILINARKSITPGGVPDNYSVTLNLTSLVNYNLSNVSVYDIIPANFTITNPSPGFNGSVGNGYYWTMDLAAGDSKIVNYNLVGSGSYNLTDAFRVGVDPVI